MAGFFAIGGGSIPISILIKNWFLPDTRGKAMGMSMAGSGLGAMALIPLANHINEAFGWRWSYLILAAGVLVVLLPICAIFISTSPNQINGEILINIKAEIDGKDKAGRCYPEM